MAYKAKTIRKMIASVCASADKLKVRTHKLAVVILNHYRQHGDTSLMAELVNELRGRGQHRRALIQWFQKHGRVALTINGNDATFVKRKGADHTTIDVDKADSLPFYDDDSTDGQTGQDLKTWNFYGRLRSDVKKAREIRAIVDGADDANKALKAAGYNPDKTPIPSDEEIEKIEAFVEAYGNLDKPTPKNEQTLFKGSHGTSADEPKLQQVG